MKSFLAITFFHFSIGDIELDNGQEKEADSSRVRDLLPFWARELLAIQDEAEKANKVHGSSARESV